MGRGTKKLKTTNHKRLFSCISVEITYLRLLFTSLRNCWRHFAGWLWRRRTRAAWRATSPWTRIQGPSSTTCRWAMPSVRTADGLWPSVPGHWFSHSVPGHWFASQGPEAFFASTQKSAKAAKSCTQLCAVLIQAPLPPFIVNMVIYLNDALSGEESCWGELLDCHRNETQRYSLENKRAVCQNLWVCGDWWSRQRAL